MLVPRQQYSRELKIACEKYFPLDRRAGRFPRHPAPLAIEDARLVLGPGIDLGCSISAAASPIGSDDAESVFETEQAV